MLRQEHLTIFRLSSHQQISFDTACLSVWHLSFTSLHVRKQYCWADEVARTLMWKSFQKSAC